MMDSLQRLELGVGLAIMAAMLFGYITMDYYIDWRERE